MLRLFLSMGYGLLYSLSRQCRVVAIHAPVHVPLWGRALGSIHTQYRHYLLRDGSSNMALTALPHNTLNTLQEWWLLILIHWRILQVQKKCQGNIMFLCTVCIHVVLHCKDTSNHCTTNVKEVEPQYIPEYMSCNFSKSLTRRTKRTC